MFHHRRRSIGAMLGLAVTTLVLPACWTTADGVRGSGTLESEVRAVSGFDEILLEGSGMLVVDVGDTESLVIEAEDNLLPLLTSEVRGTRLELRNRESISPTQTITFTIGAVAFEGVQIAGSADVIVPNLNCQTFDASVAGSGSFDVAGRCDRLELSIAGSGDFNGENLIVAAATISIAGSGNAVVTATDELEVSITGSGDVTYFGDPVTDIDIAGSGGVHRSPTG